MDRYFFRVEHELLRSEAFKTLGGSAIKVYLVLGLHSDFGTGWSFPSIRTIATRAGLSRQTVLSALDELAAAGLVAIQREQGKPNAYRLLQPTPPRPTPSRRKPDRPSGPISFEEPPATGPDSLDQNRSSGQKSLELLSQFFDASGHDLRPKQETRTKPKHNAPTASVPIPGTPFQLTAEGRLQVTVDLKELLTDQGLPPRIAQKLLAQKDAEAVAKVLLNAFYLKSQGKLQNGPGYIRVGIEQGYDLLPQVADRLESRRRELQAQIRAQARRAERRQAESKADEEAAAIAMVLERLGPAELENLVSQALASLPAPLVRRNPTLSNPFVRARVYELAGGEPLE
ncbi:MAG: hypothetical protein KatS3mg108_2434 [Isosphaeraceae bacterium]|jgi:DNA-binding transcriptional ArsR family regulator|nr:MAG: hypothetical protein KatS3mg108_2434 [Isosphaeraceae bacterium]